MVWWQWAIAVFVFLIIIISIKRKRNDDYGGTYESQTFFKKIMDACCLHRR